MDFQRQWTQFALQAEHEHFGVARIVQAHNEQIATLQSQLAASQKRERILREGLEEYADENNWYEREDFAGDGALMGFTWEHHLNGPMHAQATLKAAEEVV